VGQLSRAPQDRNAGINPEIISALPKHAVRKTTHEIISGYRATAVIDTPMRKVEVLETQDGSVIVRDTEYMPNRSQADVGLLHLRYHEAQALATVLRELEESDGSEKTQPANGNGNGKARA
jgi:hypothetical protein